MTEARWRGRIILAYGIRHDPSSLEGLPNVDCPTTGGQLQIFLCAMQQLCSSVVSFQGLAKALQEILERINAKARKHTKRAVARVHLTVAG